MSAERGVDAYRSQLGDPECGLWTEEKPPDEGRGAGRQRYRQEGTDADFGHHQFDGEHDAADRRVEGRRNAGASAGSDENDPLPRRHSHDLAQCRAKRRPDLNDRSLAPDGRAAADRDRRSQRLDYRHNGPDHASLVIDCIHHLRHAVAPGLGREPRDQERNGQRADHRHKDDQWPPGTWGVNRLAS